MRPASRRAIRFVRALLPANEAKLVPAGHFSTRSGDRAATLEASEVRDLIAQGVLRGTAGVCGASGGTRSWLRRQLLDADAFAAQHRDEAQRADGSIVNLSESPLARLAVASRGEAAPFLERHQVEAGERVRRLAERARLQPRVIMNYSAAQTAGGNSTARGGAEISDLAADTRAALAEIHRLLPRDCAGVVVDVCGLLKGLQTVETERGWLRRSAKLVLRIGLEQLALHYGLAPVAVGAESRRRRAWMEQGARPERFE
ncbi:MAG: DUF6456 domain-containing protein [Devosia sp.]|nr:DUF6456 domain-containing protein [Devosia sp.]